MPPTRAAPVSWWSTYNACRRVDRSHPALKHGAYSATTILPGESWAEFEKLHRDLMAELTPSGVLEDDIVTTVAHLVWRKKNLPTLRSQNALRTVGKQSSMRNPSFRYLAFDLSPRLSAT